MSAHTPGPWFVRCGAPLFRDGSTNVISVGGEYIAEVGHIGPEHVEADARLIAAAPELYDAAETAIETLAGCCVPAGGIDDRNAIDEAKAMLRAAIAKATQP